MTERWENEGGTMERQRKDAERADRECDIQEFLDNQPTQGGWDEYPEELARAARNYGRR